MEIILLLIGCILFIQLLFVIWNLNQLPRLGKGAPKIANHLLPTVSVLIPARNEAKRIGECLQSLVNQSNQPLEILVLDDHSTDETEFIVRSWSKKYPFIRLIKGSKLKEGWMGKVFACQQLGKAARGDWLLFLDADVRLIEGAFEKISQYSAHQKTGMISGFPKQIAQSWFEKWVVPMMMFTIACHLPVHWVHRSKDPRFVAAHGGFILIERSCYLDVGGHRRIRNALVDDMELAKLIKRNGYPFTLAHITDIAYMRMYEKASEVWEGYRKNIFPGMNRNGWVLLGVIVTYLALYVFPFLLLFISWNQPAVFLLALCSYLIGAFIKAWIDFQNGLSWWYGFLLPLSVMSILLIGVDSARMDRTKKGYVWKGRRYT